jgi:hypothetical protein
VNAAAAHAAQPPAAATPSIPQAEPQEPEPITIELPEPEPEPTAAPSSAPTAQASGTPRPRKPQSGASQKKPPVTSVNSAGF